MDKSLRRNLPLCLCNRVCCGLESPEIPARLNAACADGLHDDGAQVRTARIHRKVKDEYSKSLRFELQEGLRNQATVPVSSVTEISSVTLKILQQSMEIAAPDGFS